MNSQHWAGFTFSGLHPQSPLYENSSAIDCDDLDDNLSDMDQDLPLIDISRQGLWTISSGRTDLNDEECFLDAENLETFWWTTLPVGLAPHHWVRGCPKRNWFLIMVRFPKIVFVSQLQLYLDYGKDQTWCPRLISVSAGTSAQHLTCIMPCDEDRFTFSKAPEGWQTFNLTERNKGAPVPCTVVKVSFEQNFSNGQNMRLRGLKLFASPTDHVEPVVRPRPVPSNAPLATARPAAAHNPSSSTPAPTSTSNAAPQWQLSLFSPAHRPDPLR